MPTNPPDYGFNLNFSLADAALYPPSNSLFTERFNIPSIESDILLWDQTWEQILPTLSPEQDVYSTLKPYVLQFQGGFVHLMQRLRRLRSNVSQVQLVVTALWEGMADNRRPLLSWLFLSEEQRMQHLLFGLQLACQYTSLGQGARANIVPRAHS